MFFGFQTAFGYLFPFLFPCVFCGIIYGIVRNISTWHKNNPSPRLAGSAYGMLTEGDVGTLRFQGTRYLGFDRS